MPGPGEEVFLDFRAGGMTAEGIAEKFPPPFYFTGWLDGAAVPDKAALMTAAAAALKFPSYFGRNWDALLDCLRSLPEFNPARGYVIAVRNSSAFLAASPEDRQTFEETASEAAAFLREKLKISLKVVFF